MTPHLRPPSSVHHVSHGARREYGPDTPRRPGRRGGRSTGPRSAVPDTPHAHGTSSTAAGR